MRKIIILSLALALVVGLVGVADAAGRGAAQKRAEAAARGIDLDSYVQGNTAVQRLPAPRFVGARVPGTIQYDNGVFNASTATEACIGNQFDTTGGANPLTASGSVTAASMYMAGVGGGAAFFSMYDQLVGATANNVTSISLPMATGFNAFPVGPLNYVGATFLAGAWNFTVGTDTLGLGTGTTGGQGFHGMTIQDVVGTGFIRPGTFNGIVRTSGNIIAIPVELTGFEIVGE